MADEKKKSELNETLSSSKPDIAEEVTSWLGRLVLLYGVPFHYLIPEEDMLPRGQRYGSSSFLIGDLTDPSGLAKKLAEGKDPLSLFVWEHFSAESRRRLTDPQQTSNQKRDVLAEEIGKLLKAGSIYSDEHFGGVKLAPLTLELKAKNPQGEDLERLNRLLLEDAYPLDLRRTYRDSLRFFFLDPIWIQSLVQGACSVGSNGYGDRIIDTVMNEWVQPNQPDDEKTKLSLANKKAAGVRDRLREQYEAVPLPPGEACLAWPLTGFVLRSAVVEGWRGLEVTAYRELTKAEKETLRAKLSGKAKEILEKVMTNENQRDSLRAELRELLHSQKQEELKQLLTLAGVRTQEEFLKLLLELVTPLKPLRIEQLSKDVMLGLFNGIFNQLVIRQPQECLHFGLTAQNQFYTKTLRELGYSNPAKAGEIIPNKTIRLSDGDMMRDMSKGVINIEKLAARMRSDLAALKQLKPDLPKPNNFTSAEFAVEMIEAAGEFTYFPRIRTVS